MVLNNCIFNVFILIYKCMVFCNIFDLVKVIFCEIENIVRCNNYIVCYVII